MRSDCVIASVGLKHDRGELCGVYRASRFAGKGEAAADRSIACGIDYQVAAHLHDRSRCRRCENDFVCFADSHGYNSASHMLLSDEGTSARGSIAHFKGSCAAGESCYRVVAISCADDSYPRAYAGRVEAEHSEGSGGLLCILRSVYGDAAACIHIQASGSSEADAARVESGPVQPDAHRACGAPCRSKIDRQGVLLARVGTEAEAIQAVGRVREVGQRALAAAGMSRTSDGVDAVRSIARSVHIHDPSRAHGNLRAGRRDRDA